MIGIGAGAKGELNLGLLMAKRGRIHGSTLRYRPLEEKALTARAMERSVLPLFERGELTVPVAATFPLEQAAEAYDRFTAGGKLGKIVLRSEPYSPRRAGLVLGRSPGSSSAAWTEQSAGPPDSIAALCSAGSASRRTPRSGHPGFQGLSSRSIGACLTRPALSKAGARTTIGRIPGTQPKTRALRSPRRAPRRCWDV